MNRFLMFLKWVAFNAITLRADIMYLYMYLYMHFANAGSNAIKKMFS